MEKWEELKKDYYMTKTVVLCGNGAIDFNPEGMKEFDLNDFKSYDEYLYTQWVSLGSIRTSFQMCYYEDRFEAYYSGEIISVKPSRVLFKRILVEGMYSDGTGFKGSEDHVWMSIEGFEDYKVGDNLEFSAEVYPYIKKNKGKKLNYGLREPYDVKLISSYQTPTDEYLINQYIGQIVCETCMYSEHCYMGMCIAAPGYRDDKIKELKNLYFKNISEQKANSL